MVLGRISFIFICMFVFDFLPALIVACIVRAILKRRISKGWCVLLSVLVICISGCFCNEVFGNCRFGYLDYCIFFGTVFGILYDKEIPSILDTEKELKRKKRAKENLNV